MSSSIAEIVNDFCENRPSLGTREGAFDGCLDAAKALVNQLEAAGHEAEIVRLTEGTRQWPDAHAKWQELVSRVLPTRSYAWVHYCVLVDGSVIDVTRRQFEPDADFPHIESSADASRDWGRAEIWDMDSGMTIRDLEAIQVPSPR